jgi:hypothetical protein
MGGVHYGHTGEKNPTARYTDAEAKQMREYRAEGFTYKDIQKLYGGTISGIQYICVGKTYPHAGGPIDKTYRTINKSIIK